MKNMLLPSAYSDHLTFERERERLFRRGPQYVGHELLVPEIGSYATLEEEGHSRALMHTETGINLISNICRHRQAIMLKGQGKTKHITCPLHKWSWKTSGEMIGAPHFEKDLCKHLRTWDLKNWRGLLFEGDRDVTKDLEGVGFLEEIDFSEYLYHHTESHHCRQNWKTFMEVYGDDYHVAPGHPGLSKMVSMRDFKVITGANWHIQIVGSADKLDSRMTPAYEAWREKCLKHGKGKLPKYGALWFAYYPGIMIEVYPYTITISTLHPISATETMNRIEFYYHRDVDRDLIEKELSAYMETAAEDDDFGERMDAGRRALLELEKKYPLSDDEKIGPYHPTMEKAVAHFHEWYMREIGS